MKPLESQINLRVVNNTALPQPVSILGIVPNSNTANNNNLLYEYDLIGQSFVGIISADLVIDTVVTFNPIGYSAVVYSQSFQGLVDALNSLNKGIFSYYGTTIYVTSDYYIYGKLTI
jgi:small ligand-binding sensory domain FIST